MALGTITVTKKTQVGDGPVRFDLLSFAGDGAYPSGGSTGFQALVRAALGVGNVEVLAVIAQDCGGYQPIYDKAADKLKVYYGDNNNASDGPLVENATANLSGTTFKVLVLST